MPSVDQSYKCEYILVSIMIWYPSNIECSVASILSVQPLNRHITSCNNHTEPGMTRVPVVLTYMFLAYLGSIGPSGLDQVT